MPRARDLGIRIGVAADRPDQLRPRRPRRRPRPRHGRRATSRPARRPGRRAHRRHHAGAGRGRLRPARSPAGGAVLNGAGECTGFLTAAEWGLLETPVFLTSTMQLGRVYDAACDRAARSSRPSADDVVIPVVGECDDSFLNDCRRMQVDRPTTSRRPGARRRDSRGSPHAARRGRGRRRHRHVLPRLQGRHRHVVAGHPRRAHRRGAAADQLRRARAARPSPASRSAGCCPPPDAAPDRPAGSCIGVVVTDAPLDGRRLRAAGPPGRARPGPHRLDRPPRQRRDLPGRVDDLPRRPRRHRPTDGPRVAGRGAGRPASRPSSTPPRRRCSTRCSAPPTTVGRDGNTSEGLDAGRRRLGCCGRHGRAGQLSADGPRSRWPTASGSPRRSTCPTRPPARSRACSRRCPTARTT